VSLQIPKASSFERLGHVLAWIGYASAFLGLLLSPQLLGLRKPAAVLAVWAGCVVLAVLFLRWLDRVGKTAAFELLVLAVLPVWGCVLNAWLSPCRVDVCEHDVGLFRPFAVPELYWLLGLHAAAAFAYLISRRRSETLPIFPEALVFGAMLVGLAVDALAAIQLTFLMPYVIALPITMPLLAPGLSAVLFWREIRRRLLLRGTQLSAHRHFERGVAAGTALFGAYAVLQGVYYGSAFALARVVTRTCSAPFSLEAVELLHQRHCHYLCTVAARGHARLVCPERYGVRRGARIVVNRQLCVANAFEDLLHTRWPRLAHFLRQTYDYWGLPVSRWIRSPWAADLLYLAMKPLEWAFYVTLLLLDPECPEDRIGRMYR
jgi:hypothetical protein